MGSELRGRVLPARCRAAAPRWGWPGAAHLPGTVCLPAAARLGIAFASVLKNNPLACQGYKQRTNCFLS